MLYELWGVILLLIGLSTYFSNLDSFAISFSLLGACIITMGLINRSGRCQQMWYSSNEHCFLILNQARQVTLIFFLLGLTLSLASLVFGKFLLITGIPVTLATAGLLLINLFVHWEIGILTSHDQ